MSKFVGIDIGHGENTWEAGGGKGVRKNGKAYEEHHFNSAVGQLVDKRLKEHGFKTYLVNNHIKMTFLWLHVHGITTVEKLT